jgi:hypothetical protein
MQRTYFFEESSICAVIAFMKALYVFLFLIPNISFSKPATKSESRLSYDVSGSQSTQNGRTYQEINLGLNWKLSDWLIFRNSAFQRQAQDQDTVYGLDSSLRLEQVFQNKDQTLGLKFFGGPGVRIASEKSNAYFAEAGLSVKLGGINIGAGAKALQYDQVRRDSSGNELPRTENQVFITLSGSGTL